MSLAMPSCNPFNCRHLKRVYLPTGYADKLIKDARTTPYITYIGCHNDEDCEYREIYS